MKKKNKELAKELAYFSTLGLQIVFAIVIGYLVGIFLDEKFGTSPRLMYVFLVLGIIAGFRNIWLAIKRVEKADREGRF